MEEKLIRCICGTVYDVAKASACPDCREKAPEAGIKKTPPVKKAPPLKPRPKAKADRPASQGPDQTPPMVNSSLKWKALLFAGILLFIVFIVKSVFFKTDSKPTAALVKPPAPEQTVQPAKKISQTQKKQNTTPPQQSTTSNSSGTNYWGDKYSYDSNYNRNSFQRDNGILPPKSTNVENLLVGSWTRGGGQTQMTLYITADGQYSFVKADPRNPDQHNGSFTGKDGKWALKADNKKWADWGTYQVSGSQLTITDRNGDRAIWQRASNPYNARR